MRKLYYILEQFSKYAISKEKFDKVKSIESKEQFAILSVQQYHEKTPMNESVYLGKAPLRKQDYKNIKEHKKFVEEIGKDYKVEELSSAWVDDATNKIVKEDSTIIYNINYNKAFDLAWKNKQDAFIYKPAEGPVQLIDTNGKYIKVSNRYSWSSAEELWSKSKYDKTSFEFGFFDTDSVNLIFIGRPYLWTDKVIMDYFGISKEDLAKVNLYTKNVY
jgi:hypothetical protein